MSEQMNIDTVSELESMQIDHQSPIPLHIQVEQLLRKLLNKPEYQDGKLLPKEVDMAKRLGISRNTIRQATNKLVHENLLVRKKGVGSKAVKKSVTTKLNNWFSFSQEMQDQGLTFINFDIQSTEVLATQDIALSLEIKESRKVVKLERVRGFENGPFLYSVSFFHPRIGITINEDFTRHLYDILENDYATVPVVSKEKIKAILADDILSKKLYLNEGDPILFRERIVCDPGDRPVEFNRVFYRADRFTYSIDIKR